MLNFFFLTNLGVFTQASQWFFPMLFVPPTKHNLATLAIFYLLFFFFLIKGNACFQEKNVTSKKEMSYQSIEKSWSVPKRKNNNLSNIFDFLHGIRRPCAVYILILQSLYIYIYIYLFIYNICIPLFVDLNELRSSNRFCRLEYHRLITIIKTRMCVCISKRQKADRKKTLHIKHLDSNFLFIYIFIKLGDSFDGHRMCSSHFYNLRTKDSFH